MYFDEDSNYSNDNYPNDNIAILMIMHNDKKDNDNDLQISACILLRGNFGDQNRTCKTFPRVF